MFWTDGSEVAEVEAADTAEKTEEPEVSREPTLDMDSLDRWFALNRSEGDVGELGTLLNGVSISVEGSPSTEVAVGTPVSSRR